MCVLNNNILLHISIYFIGKAKFQVCPGFDNCEINKTLVEGQNVTFNSSVEFLNGGHQNQEITSLTLFSPSRDVLYSCSTPQTNICSNNGRVNVEQEYNGNVLIFRLSLTSVTVSDNGKYEVRMRKDTLAGEATTELSINLQVHRMSLISDTYDYTIMHT